MDQEKAENLVKNIIAGEEAAEKELFSSFKDEVAFLIKLKIGKNNPDWEDLRQEIFIAFFQRIRDGKYDSNKGSLGAFLQSIIKFKILDYKKSPAYKRRQNYNDITEIELENPRKNPEQELQDKQELELLKEAIINLDEQYKEILFLSIYKQLKVKEISKKLGIPGQKVSNLKSYALTLLKNQLTNN